MNQQEETLFCGSGKSANENFINITVCLTKLKEHVYEFNGEKYINLTVCKKKEADSYGKTHFVKLNTFKPEAKAPQKVAQAVIEEEDELPF